MGGADAGVGIFQRVADGGVDAEAADGFEIDVGLRFAAWDFVPADELREVFHQADLLEALAGDLIARGGGNAEGDFPRGKGGEDFVDAGLEGKAVAGDVVFENFAAIEGGGLEVEAGAKFFLEHDAAGAIGAADHGVEDVVGHFVAMEAGGFVPRDAGDALGVEHEAVHVEDDAEHRR